MQRAVFTVINKVEGRNAVTQNSDDGAPMLNHTSQPRRPSSASSYGKNSRTNASVSSHSNRLPRADSATSSDYNEFTPTGKQNDEETASQSTFQSESGSFSLQPDGPLRENAKPVIQTVDDPTASATAIDTQYNNKLDDSYERKSESRDSHRQDRKGNNHDENTSRLKAMKSLLLKGAAFWVHQSDATHARYEQFFLWIFGILFEFSLLVFATPVCYRFVWCSQDLSVFFIGAVNSSHVFMQIPTDGCLDVSVARPNDESLITMSTILRNPLQVYPGRKSDPSWKNSFACFTLMYDDGGRWKYLELELDDRDVREFSRGYTVESIQLSSEKTRKTIEAARNIWIEAFKLAINYRQRQEGIL